jgi:central kinetochore subunit Mal2/MCM21
MITNTLLCSTKIQNLLGDSDVLPNTSLDLPNDENPLSTKSRTSASASTNTQHQTNMHRLSFTVTTFPFADPSPTNSLHGRLLGLRFDQCSHLGMFQKPYYILLRRVEEGGDEWRVHRHTIPAFVPLGRLEEEFLPLRDEDGSDDEHYGAEDESGSAGVKAKKQDLHSFVRKIRHELTSWNLRREAIDFLKSELRLVTPPATAKEGDESEEDGADDTEMTDSDSTTQGLYGVQSIEATSFEARQARITWTDGTIGRIKISNRGLVEKAVVVGEGGRIRGVENLLVDGESRVEELVGKLRVLVGEES